jgi:hypothetical protein
MSYSDLLSCVYLMKKYLHNMAAQRYFFVSNWKVQCPLEEAWNAIYDVHEWRNWWPSIAEVKTVSKGDANDIGRIEYMKWRTPFFYELSFSVELLSKQMPIVIVAHATGELEGTGTWKFFHEKGVTNIIHEWSVSTTKKWMNDLAFILKPLFFWNHHYVMNKGAKGLAKKLNARLISTSDR